MDIVTTVITLDTEEYNQKEIMYFQGKIHIIVLQQYYSVIAKDL
jgi:hypothetical protein